VSGADSLGIRNNEWENRLGTIHNTLKEFRFTVCQACFVTPERPESHCNMDNDNLIIELLIK
jgi:hypothetical protein